MKDLGDRLAALSPEQRALLESRLKQKGLDRELTAPRPHRLAPIEGRERLSHFPTSLDQERLWFIDQMEPGNPAYNIHTSSRLIGPMDAELMRRAINLSIARHEVLRTTFGVVEGRAVQVVAPKLEIPLEPIDLSHVPEDRKDAEALRTAIEFHSFRFDLERGPLVRAGLIRLGPEDHVLLVCMQHAITDRWSFDIFEAEVGELYVALREGRTVEFPPLPIQFADFAAWQREELSGERLERHLDYWRAKLAGVPQVLEIPTDRPRPPVQTFAGARRYLIYSETLLFTLKALTQRAGATMFMTMLAALDVLCWKYSGQRDLIIGSAIADRNRTETESVIGYFLNMLLLRGTIDPKMTFAQLLAQVRETSHGAFAHQEVPFATLVETLGVKQDPSRNPLIQVSYIYLDFPISTTPEYAGFQASSLDVDNGASRFDLTLACTEVPGLGLHSYIEYNSDLYDAAKVDGMLFHLGRVLEFAAAHADRPLTELALLTEEESRVLLEPGEAIDFDPEILPARVEAAARRAPEAGAITFAGRTHCYAEVDQAAESIAGALRARGVTRGAIVPVAIERSFAQAAALLGVWKAGAAYIPLDLALPPERVARMLKEIGPAFALTSKESQALFAGIGLPVLLVEDALLESTPPSHAPRASLDDLAYVMFTSGSTGVPKGVMVSHRAILNRVLWSAEVYPLHADDVVLQSAAYSFDIAAWELFAPWIAGARVVMPDAAAAKDPAELARLLHDERVTVAHFVPSLLRALLDEPLFARCDALRVLLCGGESMDRELHDRVLRVMPGRALAHFYGPTEAAISSLHFAATPALEPGAVPIGRPIANTYAYLLDDELHPVPRGVPGEIYLGGICLARGYLAQAALTADRFVPDPISGEAGARLYRTGDLARYRADGEIEFLGRADHQVKIRGHRIELGEIESVLARQPGVKEVVAIARGPLQDQRLVAYLALEGADGASGDATSADVTSDNAAIEDELRSALRRALPEYMVPSALVLLPALPRNANGKIDRAALPEPGEARPRHEPIAPRTPIEEAVAEVWHTVLKRQPTDVTESFFDLGGNSLLATQVVSRLRARFEIELPLRRFFEGSTIEALAAVVDEALLARLESMSEEEAAELLARWSRPAAFDSAP